MRGTLTTTTETWLKATTGQRVNMLPSEYAFLPKGTRINVGVQPTASNHYQIKLDTPLGGLPGGFIYCNHATLVTQDEHPDTVGDAPLDVKKLPFDRAVLAYLQLLGWDLEHQESRTKPGQHWVSLGIRDIRSTGQPVPHDFWSDEFNDRIIECLWIPASNTWQVLSNDAATTEPGVYYTKNPMNSSGAARLKTGIQFKAWKRGLHGSSQYPALVQAKELTYYRDGNKDGEAKGDREYTSDGNGINRHKSDGGSTIRRYGAGCQVKRIDKDHYFMMSLADSYRPADGYYSYGVIEGEDFYAFWQGGVAPVQRSPAILVDPIEKIGTVGDSYIRQFDGDKAFFYRAGLAIDADGGYRSYHPEKGKGLDLLGNAGKPGNWWALACRDGAPVVQGAGDPAPGYYVSMTTLEDASQPPTSPLRWVDSETVPYIVLPCKHRFGAKLGDLAMVYNSANGKLCSAIFADTGPNDKIGEGSIALAIALDINPSPINGGVDDGLAFVVFPDSRPDKLFPLQLPVIIAQGQKLFADWGGVARLAIGLPKLFS
jgi:hypothetical protein